MEEKEEKGGSLGIVGLGASRVAPDQKVPQWSHRTAHADTQQPQAADPHALFTFSNDVVYGGSLGGGHSLRLQADRNVQALHDRAFGSQRRRRAHNRSSPRPARGRAAANNLRMGGANRLMPIAKGKSSAPTMPGQPTLGKERSATGRHRWADPARGRTLAAKLRLPILQDVMLPPSHRARQPKPELSNDTNMSTAAADIAQPFPLDTLGGSGPGSDAEAGSWQDSGIVPQAFGDEQTEELEALLQLKTGEDAITFFARHGSTTPIKFVYCNRARTGDVYRPFDLVVVKAKEVDAEHFTISASGVVHVMPGQPSEFISLADWMHESTAFNILRNIGFFKHYLVAKMFKRWRGNVRYNLYIRQRSRLQSSLFLARPSFCSSLIEARKVMYNIANTSVLKVQKEVSEQADFEKDQSDQREDASKKFREYTEKLHDIAVEVCHDVKERVRNYEAEVAEENAYTGFAYHLTGQSGRTKSMVAAKREKAERQRRLKHALKEASLLGTFIRLIDYMQAEHLAEVCLTAAKQFHTELRLREKVPLFKTVITFDPTLQPDPHHSTIVFSPTEADFHKMLNGILESMIGTVDTVEHVLAQKEFREFVKYPVMGPRVDVLVHSSRSFQSSVAAITHQISNDFTKAREKVRPQEGFRKLFDLGLRWDTEFADKEHHVSSLQQDITKMLEWKGQVSALPDSRNLKIFQIDLSEFKKQIVPTTKRALKDTKNALKDIFKANSDRVQERFNQFVKDLSGDPKDLRKFAIYVEKFRHIRQQGDQLIADAREVDDLFQRLKHYDIHLDPDYIRVDTQHLMREFDRRLDESQARIKEKMLTMQPEVEKNNQKLHNKLNQIRERLGQDIYVSAEMLPEQLDAKMKERSAVDEVLDALTEVSNKLEGKLKEEADMLKQYQELFNMEQYPFNLLDETKQEWAKRNDFWVHCRDWLALTYSWDNDPLHQIDVERMHQQVDEFMQFAIRTHREQQLPLTAKFKDMVQRWKGWMPAIMELGDKSMQSEHWRQLFTKLGQAYRDKKGIKLRKIREMGIFSQRELISAVCEQAQNEARLHSQLQDIVAKWQDQEFLTVAYEAADGMFILGDVEEVTALLEESQVNLQGMLGSRFIGANPSLQQKVKNWDKDMSFLSELLDDWLLCQRNWMYLEPIFSSEDIIRHLPEEADEFAQVNAFWREVMSKLHASPKVLPVVRGMLVPNMRARLDLANQQLDHVQKQLEEFLETKRRGFPRFYFLSNDELLQILSQARDPQAVQPHLRKMFDNIASVIFTDEQDSVEVVAMVSSEGEKIGFPAPVFTKGATEEWLCEIESRMRLAVKTQINSALKGYPSNQVDRASWFSEYSAQGVSTVDQIMWTFNCQSALRRLQGAGGQAPQPGALKEFLAMSQQQINGMVQTVRGDLTRLQRRMMGTLIIIDVHARDVVQEMVADGVSGTDDFQWTKQMRYFWEPPEDQEEEMKNDADTAKSTLPLVPDTPDDISGVDCVLRQINSHFVYGYEYLGVFSRLVITPLTDKACLTLTGALHLCYGGAPAGPAGTGKTETVKDLAKAMAVQIVVFNCSESLNANMMGRFFAGLAQAGAWACFDEFNRLDIEVLSVIAQQVSTIQRALKARQTRFDFQERRDIRLSRNFGVFITMNPGYAGRTELPDNLKALFRPVAMMIPDYALIAQIVLYSEGFETADVLAKKMVQLYKLSSEQLSKQDHYDFGMRAVKSVLVMAGALKRAHPDLKEDVVLIRAMRDSNVPKFLSQDLPLFRGIVTDLFPGVDVPLPDYGHLQRTIEQELRVANLQPVPSFVSKILQLHETMMVRHGVMVVGSTATGKSKLAETLAAALTRLAKSPHKDTNPYFKQVQRFLLNPKAVTMGELYGSTNPVTLEWQDGLVAWLIRHAAEDTTDSRKWIVFDGPVDALWIENMNTVLDDNKVLTLANAERIKLPSTITMLFEVEDLSVASPATVSRCGMVYIEPDHLGWEPIIDSWAVTFNQKLEVHSELAEEVIALLKKHIGPVLAFIRKECQEMIPSVDNNLVASCLRLIDSLLVAEKGVNIHLMELEKLRVCVLLQVFIGIVWSFGANLHERSRPAFSVFLMKQLAADLNVLKLPSALLPDNTADSQDDEKKAVVASQGDVTVFDFAVDLEELAFVPWKTLVRDFDFDPEMPYFNILVPTADTTKHRFLVDTLLSAGQNVLLSGETGVGKTVLVRDYVSSTASSGGDNASPFVFVPVTFSAQTTSQNLQDVLETKLEKKRKTLLGAPPGKRVLVFVDDVNMPTPEVYGAQPAVELFRQCLDQKGFYDRKKLFFKSITDVQFVAACAPPGGGRNKMTNRLTRHFHMVWQPDLSSTALRTIFSAIVGGYLRHISPADDPRSLTPLCTPLVEAAVDMYTEICQHMRPTPSRSHYTFNLRDLSSVFQGIVQVESHHLPDRDTVVRLWLHETAREFRDRLIDDDDRKWFDATCAKMIPRHFSSVLKNANVEWQEEQFREVLFGDFADMNLREYMEMDDWTQLQASLNGYVEDFNLTYPHRASSFVFFKDAVFHLARLVRTLRRPRGNALLVGVGGSGRQSLTRLATYIAGHELRTVEITRNYDRAEWYNDLRDVLETAGADNRSVVFLLSDTQVVDESFLEDINNILNTGEVPNLFDADQLEQIMDKVRPLAQAHGRTPTRDNVLDHFVQLVRENLHMVLAFSPIGDTFRTRCRQYPALVNCCTIDWYSAWPEDALYSVARTHLATADNSDAGNRSGNSQEEMKDDKLMDLLCRVCVKIHQTVGKASVDLRTRLRRFNYTTPTSYLELLSMYNSMLQEQRAVVTGNYGRYTNGLAKLQETNKQVSFLKEELVQLQPKLKVAVKDAAEKQVQLEADQKVANQKASVVQKEKEAFQVEFKQVSQSRDECEKDLSEVMPIYESAVQALNTLDPKDISEVRTFGHPPKGVVTTMEAVSLLLSGKVGTWEEAQKLLQDAKGFIKRCVKYDKDNIPSKTINKLKKYIANEDFDPDKLKSVSRAAVSLCMWARAMFTYSQVFKKVAPKKAKLAAAEKSLAAAKAALETKEAEVAEVNARVASLKAMYRAKLAERDELQHKELQTKQRLDRAEELVSGLSSEEKRWAAEAERLKADLTNLTGNVLLSAGCVSYLGPFPADFRHDLCSEWVQYCNDIGLPVDPAFSLTKVLAVPVVVRQWQTEGLPADQYSIQNGILCTRTRRWPLLIDPQGQANRWIRAHRQSDKLEVVKSTDQDVLRKLEAAIRFGQPVLLENVTEQLDAALEPLLSQNVQKKAGGMRVIQFNDQEVPYSPEFALYLTTKLSNPRFSPEIFVKMTVINFTVTLDGLSDQMLEVVVAKESPETEAKNEQLTINLSKDRQSLDDIEKKILSKLSHASGNILDDEELVDTLKKSKATSTEISQRLVETQKTKEEIEKLRENYRPVAIRASTLYFAISDLAAVDPMYQYSLQWFLGLFTQSIASSPMSSDLAVRLTSLTDHFTQLLYESVCRSLFEQHKMLFSFLLAVRILSSDGKLSDQQWRFLVAGLATLPGSRKNPAPEWLVDGSWKDVQALAQLPAFKGFLDDFIKPQHLAKYRAMFDSAEPHLAELPQPWDSKLDSFQRMLVLKCLRPDKIVPAVTLFVQEHLGDAFTESPPFDLEYSFKGSSPGVPIVFVLSRGSNPATEVFKLAESMNMTERLSSISLGQGQGPIAAAMITKAQREGGWVLLQNCHLAASWLPELEQICLQSSALAEQGQLHDNYRLWLTSMPSKSFPVSILQNSVKITNEPPRGLRANLKRSFTNFTDEWLLDSPNSKAFRKFLYALCSFHAVVLERRKFGPLGWNIPYDFTENDLDFSIAQVREFIRIYPEDLPYDVVRFLTADINYGGRVTDGVDLRTIRTILSKFINPDIMSDDYSFSDSDTYKSPPALTAAEYVKHIEQLPATTETSMFGMHPNAEITSAQQTTLAMFSTFMLLMPRDAGSAGQSREEKIEELARGVLAKVPPSFDLEDVMAKYPTQYEESMNTVVVQEAIRYNRLLATIRGTLSDLIKALKGEMVMTQTLDQMADALYNNQVPANWAAVAYPSLMPLSSWVTDLVARVDFIANWVEHGTPSVFWISGFFFPQAFLTGTLQNYARRHMLPIDTVSFGFEVLDVNEEPKNPPEDGVYIRGLFLEGARWDGQARCLADSRPKELYTQLPVVWLRPQANRRAPDTGVYQCPVYKVLTRRGQLSTTGHSTNFVLFIDLPSREDQAKWIQAGVALFCSLRSQ